jgi:hypothetical protein
MHVIKKNTVSLLLLVIHDYSRLVYFLLLVGAKFFFFGDSHSYLVGVVTRALLASDPACSACCSRTASWTRSGPPLGSSPTPRSLGTPHLVPVRSTCGALPSRRRLSQLAARPAPGRAQPRRPPRRAGAILRVCTRSRSRSTRGRFAPTPRRHVRETHGRHA